MWLKMGPKFCTLTGSSWFGTHVKNATQFIFYAPMIIIPFVRTTDCRFRTIVVLLPMTQSGNGALNAQDIKILPSGCSVDGERTCELPLALLSILVYRRVVHTFIIYALSCAWSPFNPNIVRRVLWCVMSSNRRQVRRRLPFRPRRDVSCKVYRWKFIKCALPSPIHNPVRNK